MEWFSRKTAVVTGAAHGIGRSVAEQLVELGAMVVAVDRDGDALASAFADGPIAVCPGDVSADPTDDLARAIGEFGGPVDLLVNNVGIDTAHGFLDLEPEDFDQVFNANLRGPWFLTRALAHDMVRRANGGAILFISSLHDHIPERPSACATLCGWAESRAGRKTSPAWRRCCCPTAGRATSQERTYRWTGDWGW